MYRDRGDEFVLVGIGKEPIANAQLIEWKGDFTREVRGIDLSDCISFDREYPKPEHLYSHVQGISISPDFKLSPQISIGFASAMLALAEFELGGRSTNYPRAIRALVGKLLDLSDHDSRENQEKKLKEFRGR